GSLVAASILALPAAAVADARDYPTHAMSAAHSGRGSHGGGSHFHGRFQSRRSTMVILPPYYSSYYDAPPAYASPPPVYAPPPVIYAPSVSYGAPAAAYGPPQTAYAPPPAPSAPPPPPMPRSVEFGSGRCKPTRSDASPMIHGEAASPSRCMSIVVTAKPRARSSAGSTLAMAALSGPMLTNSRTSVTNIAGQKTAGCGARTANTVKTI